MGELPIIDISPLLTDGPAQSVYDELRKACQNEGFFYIVNHGIPAEVLDGVFAESAKFFALPLEEKIKISAKDTPNRGYFCVGEENLDPEKQSQGDLKEGIDLGIDLPPEDPVVVQKLRCPNKWPSQPPEFREAVQRYFDSVNELARTVVRALASSLELPATYFDKYMTKPEASLRLLHYPPATHAESAEDDRAPLGAGAHTDYGMLTILAQDAVGGLEVRHRDGSWVSARPIPRAFVVNIGDVMARWTNDLFTSTLHRVRRTAVERYSIALFFDPNLDALVECVETCKSADHPAKYPPLLFADHLRSLYLRTFDKIATTAPPVQT